VGIRFVPSTAAPCPSRDLKPQSLAHGTHRDVSRRHLQVYLDEYTFRHNRRRTPLAAFQTLLGLSALRQPTTSHQITRRAA
jgi:hypothetical protein